MNEPLVSVIMPAHNAATFVEQSIESALNQTTGDLELIVCDDASDDCTTDLVSAYVKLDSRVKLIGMPSNSGAARARNAAIEIARGRYIAFLDSDDLWQRDKLCRQLDLINSTGTHFCFSSYDRIDSFGKKLSVHRVSKKISYHDLLKTNVIGCSTVIYDTATLGKMYFPAVPAEDYALWLRILRVVGEAVPVPESLVSYRVHSGSVSANKIKAAKDTWRVYREVEGFGLARSLYYFAHYGMHGVRNTYLNRGEA